MRNDEVLQKVEEKQYLMYMITKRKRAWTGHIIRKKDLS